MESLQNEAMNDYVLVLQTFRRLIRYGELPEETAAPAPAEPKPATDLDIQEWVYRHHAFVPHPAWIAHGRELYLGVKRKEQSYEAAKKSCARQSLTLLTPETADPRPELIIKSKYFTTGTAPGSIEGDRPVSRMPLHSTAEQKQLRDATILLFVLAWLVGLAGSVHPGTFGFGRGFEMASVARSLTERGAFANPFYPSITGPSAFVPPLYPLLLASLVNVFGWPLPAALIASIAFNAITAALMPRLSKTMVQDTRPGILAGCLWITAMPLMPEWDVSWTIACLVLGCVFTSRSMATPGLPKASKVVAAGLLGGMISLLNPVALLPFGLWIGFLLSSRRLPRKAAACYAAAILLIVAACNAPWAIRNYRIWHALVLRTNFGTTLYSSNNDCAVSSLVGVGRNGCYQRTYPAASDSELQLMQQLGEVAYDRQKTADAMAWIRAHPLRFGWLTMQRIAEFWFPDPALAGPRVYAIWLITLLSVPGIILMIRHREKVSWFLLLVWIVYPLVYYVVYSNFRYRYPILWASLLPASYCLAYCKPFLMRILRPARLGRQA